MNLDITCYQCSAHLVDLGDGTQESNVHGRVMSTVPAILKSKMSED